MGLFDFAAAVLSAPLKVAAVAVDTAAKSVDVMVGDRDLDDVVVGAAKKTVKAVLTDPVKAADE